MYLLNVYIYNINIGELILIIEAKVFISINAVNDMLFCLLTCTSESIMLII